SERCCNIVPIAIQRADRYMYFPVVVLFALFGLALTRIWNRRTELSRHAVTFTVGGVILACIVLTVARVEVWSNSGTLWADHRTDYPFTSTGILNEGVYYFRTGDFETAEYLMTRLVRLHPNQWKGYRILGNIAFSRNEFPEAVDFYNDMLRFVPPGENIGVQDNFGRSLVMVGLESHEDGDFITADFYYNAATEYIPTNPVLYNNLGFNYMQMGDLTAALTVLQRAIDLNPDYTTPYSNLLLIAQRTNNGELAAFAQQNLQRLGAAETP
ncbi:MAG: tetratricopeptide repeat protein, partial [Chloroflexota bacterium]